MESRGHASLAAGFGDGHGVSQRSKPAEPLPVQPGPGVRDSRRRVNLYGGQLLVIFQGRNFHQGLFRAGAMHALGAVRRKPQRGGIFVDSHSTHIQTPSGVEYATPTGLGIIGGGFSTKIPLLTELWRKADSLVHFMFPGHGNKV
jgi:hypothetical protein